jgi:hypothetical protein
MHTIPVTPRDADRPRLRKGSPKSSAAGRLRAWAMHDDPRERREAMDFFLSPGFVTVLLLFYWVPFAIGAYFADHWKPERTRESIRKLLHPRRHIRVNRPATAS